LKDIVLKLQAYTMEVNKTLYEERIHVLSDMGQPKDDRIDFHISDDEVEEPYFKVRRILSYVKEKKASKNIHFF